MGIIEDEIAFLRNSSTKTGEFVDEMRVNMGQSPYFTIL